MAKGVWNACQRRDFRYLGRNSPKTVLKANRHKASFPTNEELVSAIAENKNEALEYLYKHSFPTVRQFIIKNNGSETDAHDIFQEAIVATWMNIREQKYHFQNGSSIEGYLFQIARNKWLDRLRSKSFQSTLRLSDEELARQEPIVDEDDQSQDNLAYLQSLYQRIGDQCKRILKAFYYQKKSLKEISAEMDYDAETLRTMKYRCMMKLRKMHSENSKTGLTKK